jgi:hypothetical protein
VAQAERREEERRANKRDRAKSSRSRRSEAAGHAEFDALDWVAIACLAEALMENDGAIRVGRTRDGGAWAIGIYLGDDYATEYVRPQEAFSDALVEIAQAWLPDGGQKFYDRFLKARAQAAR